MSVKSLKNIVNHYIQVYRQDAENELRWFAIQRSFTDAVQLAAIAQGPGGKRFIHQWRIKEYALKESQNRLLRSIKQLQSVSTFEELHQAVESIISDIKGIGNLTAYDTALRIGANLGLEPDRVYLHAGTLDGAKRLGIVSSEKSISIQVIPNELRRLKPREIEDALCIYKEYFDTRELFVHSGSTRCYC